MIPENLQKALTEVRPLPITFTVDDLDFMPEDENRYELMEENYSCLMHSISIINEPLLI